MMVPAVRQEIRISAVIAVFEQAAASQATWSSKNRVCPAPCRPTAPPRRPSHDPAGHPRRVRLQICPDRAQVQRPPPAPPLPPVNRGTAFATDAKAGQLADLELRHRRRARCEDRIRCAKDTGLRGFPLHGFAQNQIWCELVAMAYDLLAWMAMLALDRAARAWEPKRLRLRLFSAARLVRGGRRRPLRLAVTWPSASRIIIAIIRLQDLAPG
jgi:hypothetical protein